MSIKNEFQEAEKVYACLFTSCATGAVHLELNRSMTTKLFLSALTGMMSKRGMIDVILWDNFRSFKNADKAPPILESYLKLHHIGNGQG